MPSIVTTLWLCLPFCTGLIYDSRWYGWSAATPATNMFGNQMPPPHEPDAILINNPNGGGPPRGPGGMYPPGQPGHPTRPGFGFPMVPPFGYPGQAPGMPVPGVEQPGFPGPGNPNIFPGVFNFHGRIPQFGMGGIYPAHQIYASPGGFHAVSGIPPLRGPIDVSYGTTNPNNNGHPDFPHSGVPQNPPMEEPTHPPEETTRHPNGGFIPNFNFYVPGGIYTQTELRGAYPGHRGFHPKRSPQGSSPKHPRAYPSNGAGFFPETPGHYPGNREKSFPETPEAHPSNREGLFPHTPGHYPGNGGYQPGGYLPEKPEERPDNREGLSPETRRESPGKGGFRLIGFFPGRNFPGGFRGPQDSSGHFPKTFFGGGGREVNDEPDFPGIDISPLKTNSE